MAIENIWILPTLTAATILLAFGIPFGLAVMYDHVDALLPYISDLGAFSPESSIFGQLLNISALLIAFCFYLRHLQVISLIGPNTASFVFLVLAYISSFGLSLVANFQENAVPTVHFIGASLCFGFGNIYCYGHTYLSWRMGSGWPATVARAVISFIGTAAMITCYYRDIFSGYTEHLISTFSEWILGFSFVAFVLSFIYELRSSSYEYEQIRVTGRLERIINEERDPKADYQFIEGDTILNDGEMPRSNAPNRADTLFGVPTDSDVASSNNIGSADRRNGRGERERLLDPEYYQEKPTSYYQVY